MINLNKSRGKIIEKFGSYGGYAEKTGYRKTDLSKFLNGKREIDFKFATTFIKECDVNVEEAYLIFFGD